MESQQISSKLKALNELIQMTEIIIGHQDIKNDSQIFFTAFYIANKCKMLKDDSNPTIIMLNQTKNKKLNSIIEWYNKEFIEFEKTKQAAIDKLNKNNTILSQKIEEIQDEITKLELDLIDKGIELNELTDSTNKANLQSALKSNDYSSALNSQLKEKAKNEMSIAKESAANSKASFETANLKLHSVALKTTRLVNQLTKKFEEFQKEQSLILEKIKLIHDNNFVITSKIQKAENLFLTITTEDRCTDGLCSIMGGITRRKRKHANKKKKTKRNRTKRR
jgi:hypothetical protein